MGIDLKICSVNIWIPAKIYYIYHGYATQRKKGMDAWEVFASKLEMFEGFEDVLSFLYTLLAFAEILDEYYIILLLLGP